MQDKRSFAFSSFRTQRVTFFLLALLLGLLVYLERNTLKKAPIDLVSLDTELQNHIDSLKLLEKKKTTVRKIKDINKATAKELMLIHGIGAVFSNRIVKYRERVGGFDLINQLHQVYGLDSLVVSKIEEKYQVLIPPKRDKIALAEVTLKYLFEIPFLSRNEAKKIITLRTKNKNISLKSLQDQAVLDSLKIERLALYL
jgi:competence ComEA-like helix-hairpin-helix protein